LAGQSPQEGGSSSGAELYDPAAGTFTATADMSADFGYTATPLPNGKVLICCFTIYDPPTGIFSPTGSTLSGYASDTATLLPSGKVLVAGGDIGDGEGGSNQAELYNPATGTFAAGNLTTGREYNATTLLPDGTVLFAGGHGADRSPGGGYDNLTSAEIYDPATGAFRAAGAMNTGRDFPQATLLMNGQVLITGGNEYYPQGAGARDPHHPEVSIAELYTPPVLVTPPALLSIPGGGSGQGAILHASTHQRVSPDNPGVAGEALEIYLTGLTDGSVIPPQVAIGGRLAEVLFFGKAPGFANLDQVNVSVPQGVAPGPPFPYAPYTWAGRATMSP
jgi:hypothetical protein